MERTRQCPSTSRVEEEEFRSMVRMTPFSNRVRHVHAQRNAHAHQAEVLVRLRARRVHPQVIELALEPTCHRWRKAFEDTLLRMFAEVC